MSDHQNRDRAERLFAMFEDYLTDGFARATLPAARAEDVHSDIAGASSEDGRPETIDPGVSSGGENEIHPAHRPPIEASGLPPDEERTRELAQLAEKIRGCTACPLSAVRTNAVPGYGVIDADVMVIGEGPGAEEDRRGEPFVGRSGNYLDKWLAAIEIYRDRNAFIANIVKCRPPQNRDPLPDERKTCFPYLERQIELVRPKTILTVGRISSRVMTGVDASMGELRKGEYDFRGIPVVATYHPSAVLRNENLRRPVWEDLKRLRSIITGEG
ncbi:MAG: uracil-DNA glycosylase family protein [Spirochaetales bacterium]